VPVEANKRMKRVLALILAGGRGERLSILSQERAKPAVPFAGKYRMIDFTLSNCANSEIHNVAVLTQYCPHSINDHIGIGRPWDLDRRGGIRLLQPYLGRGDSDWYKGTADAVYQNLRYVEEQDFELVLILGGDHIYKMDYRNLITFHEQKEADLTIGATEVPLREARRFGVITTDSRGMVIDFAEKPKKPKGSLISMGIYVFNRQKLIDCLIEDAEDKTSAHDFGRSIVTRLLTQDKVFAYSFHGYWRDVGTVQSYWQANMDLLASPPALALEDDWVIYTKSEERTPAFLSDTARVTNSLISHGCIIEGSLNHSVLSPGVKVGSGAVINDSIVMLDSVIGRGSVVDRCILDKEVVVGEDCYLGFGDDFSPNKEESSILNTGISLVGKRARIPPGTKIGRNCKVYPQVTESDFVTNWIPSGESVKEGKGAKLA